MLDIFSPLPLQLVKRVAALRSSSLWLSPSLSFARKLRSMNLSHPTTMLFLAISSAILTSSRQTSTADAHVLQRKSNTASAQSPSPEFGSECFGAGLPAPRAELSLEALVSRLPCLSQTLLPSRLCSKTSSSGRTLFRRRDLSCRYVKIFGSKRAAEEPRSGFRLWEEMG